MKKIVIKKEKLKNKDSDFPRNNHNNFRMGLKTKLYVEGPFDLNFYAQIIAKILEKEFPSFSTEKIKTNVQKFIQVAKYKNKVGYLAVSNILKTEEDKSICGIIDQDYNYKDKKTIKKNIDKEAETDRLLVLSCHSIETLILFYDRKNLDSLLNEKINKNKEYENLELLEESFELSFMLGCYRRQIHILFNNHNKNKKAVYGALEDTTSDENLENFKTSIDKKLLSNYLKCKDKERFYLKKILNEEELKNYLLTNYSERFYFDAEGIFDKIFVKKDLDFEKYKVGYFFYHRPDYETGEIKDVKDPINHLTYHEMSRGHDLVNFTIVMIEKLADNQFAISQGSRQKFEKFMLDNFDEKNGFTKSREYSWLLAFSKELLPLVRQSLEEEK